TLAGQPFAEKPPLTYWLAGFSMRAVGTNPAAARLPQLLYAIVAFIAVLRLARRLLPEGSVRAQAAGRPTTAPAWVAASLFATMALVCQVQVWLDTDALLLAGVCVALEGMYAGLTAVGSGAAASRARLRGYATMHAGLATAFFAKNFAAWLVPLLAFLCFIAWERLWRELWRWELHVGVPLLAGLIAAWVVAVAHRPDGTALLRTLFHDNLLGRALSLAAPTGADYAS